LFGLLLPDVRAGIQTGGARMSETLQHTRSCPALTPGNYEECTCGLRWRIELQTEREMHNAWRKRAEEAEATPPQADETLPAGAKTPGEDAWLDEMIVCDTKDQLRTILRAYRANLLAQPSGAQGPELAEARLSIPAHHDDDDRLWLAAEEKRLAALVLSRDNHAWLASATPRPDLIAVSEKVWGVRFDGQMVCAPTIEEAVTVLRSGLAAKDKPPAAPLCGKRIPETGLGCTLEPGHQGRHDVDVTKVSEAPMRKRLEGVLPSIAIRIHAYMSAAQNLPYEEGETCEECEDIARELIELAGQATSEEPPIESTMSMQKACETIAEKEIKKWYSHSEGARAAHNIWSEIRALAARPKEEPK
jgi:hypothetical protein